MGLLSRQGKGRSTKVKSKLILIALTLLFLFIFSLPTFPQERTSPELLNNQPSEKSEEEEKDEANGNLTLTPAPKNLTEGGRRW